jgi:hypothetical protein
MQVRLMDILIAESRRSLAIAMTVAIALFGASNLSPVQAQNEQYEELSTLKASNIVPKGLLSGPHHRVQESVTNNGFMNFYTIDSKFGAFVAASDATLRKRIQEIKALAVIEAVEGTQVYFESAAEAGEDAMQGLENLVTDPAGAASGAVSGVVKVFDRTGEWLFGSARSKAEDSKFETLIGFSKTKREYAYEFGVDVYSSNPVLQERLDEIAWSGYWGGLSLGAAMAAIPGVAGILVSTAGTSDLLNELFRTTAPVDLRKMSREKLRRMGIEESVAELFIDNSIYTPREQTILVHALESLKDVGNRSAFVKLAVLTDHENVAFFRQRQAEMYAAYHAKVSPIVEFIPIGKLVAARTTEGSVAFLAPVDYLVWTKSLARFARSANQLIASMFGVEEKVLWLTGSLSPLAQENFKKMGWEVRDNADTTLMESPK